MVAGAVAGGGLTVIANAPNPAGAGILQDSEVFDNNGISPLGLFLGAVPDAEKASALRTADVLVAPNTARESFGSRRFRISKTVLNLGYLPSCLPRRLAGCFLLGPAG